MNSIYNFNVILHEVSHLMFNVEKKNPGDAQTQERALSLSHFPWMNPSWESRERWERWQSGCLLDCICKEHVRDEGKSGKSAFPRTPISMAYRDKGAC